MVIKRKKMTKSPKQRAKRKMTTLSLHNMIIHMAGIKGSPVEVDRVVATEVDLAEEAPQVVAKAAINTVSIDRRISHALCVAR